MSVFAKGSLYTLYGVNEADIQIGNFRTHGPCRFRRMFLPAFASGELPYFSFCGVVGSVADAAQVKDVDWMVIHTMILPEKKTEHEFIEFMKGRTLIRVISDPVGAAYDTHEDTNEYPLLYIAIQPFTEGQPGDEYITVFLGEGRLFLSDGIFEMFKNRLVSEHGFTTEQVSYLEKEDIAFSGDLLNLGSGEFRLNLSHLRREYASQSDTFRSLSDIMEGVFSDIASAISNTMLNTQENQNESTREEQANGTGTDDQTRSGHAT